MEHAPESWIDHKVQVKIFGDKGPLIGVLTEANNRGIVVQTESEGKGTNYPDSEGFTVLAFVPMSKVKAILRFK
jgi:hypothetical protein